MQCPKCKTENPEVAKFCLKCGAKLVSVCPQCETELPPQAEFCIACGTQLVTPPPEAMRVMDQGERMRLYGQADRNLALPSARLSSPKSEQVTGGLFSPGCASEPYR